MARGRSREVTILLYAGAKKRPPVRDAQAFPEAISSWQLSRGSAEPVMEFECSLQDLGDRIWGIEVKLPVPIGEAEVVDLVKALLPLHNALMVVILGAEIRGQIRWICPAGVTFAEVEVEREE